MVTFRQPAAQGGGSPWPGQHAFQKAQDRQPSSHPIGAGEEIRRRQPPLGKHRLQQGHGAGLADQIGEQAAHEPARGGAAGGRSGRGWPHPLATAC